MTVTALGRRGTSGTFGSDVVCPSFTSTAGSKIIVVVCNFNDFASFANGDISDSKSNGYTFLWGTTRTGSQQIHIGVWEQNGGTRGTSHTITYDCGATEGANIAVYEVSFTGTSLEFQSSSKAVASDGATPFAVTAAAAITTPALAIGAWCADTGNNTAITSPSGYTDIHDEPDGTNFLVSNVCDLIGATGTPTIEWASSHTIGSAGCKELIATWTEKFEPVFVSAPSAPSHNTATVPLPSNIVSGNTLLLFWHDDSGNSPSTPSGWSVGEAAFAVGGGTHRMGYFWRVADGNEGANIVLTWTLGAFTEAWTCQYRGAHATTPVNVDGHGGNDANVCIAPSVSTTVANCTSVVVADFDGASNGATAPSGWTRRLNGNNTYNFYCADRVEASSGATGTTDFTATGVCYDGAPIGQVALRVALAPAGGATTVEATMSGALGGLAGAITADLTHEATLSAPLGALGATIAAEVNPEAPPAASPLIFAPRSIIVRK